MHYCTSAIFFYKTGPIILILAKKLLCKCALLSLFESISALEEEFQIAIDVGEWLAAHMVLLSMSEFILFIWIVIWSPLLLSNICMCFNNISLFPLLLDVYGMLFLWSYMYRWYIKCSNIALIPLFNDLSRVILEWIKVHVYWIESSTCLFINIDHQALHFKVQSFPGLVVVLLFRW